MWKILEKFQKDLINNVINEALELLQLICADLAEKTFFFEKLFGDGLYTNAFEMAYDMMYMMCCTLLVLKLLWKGWNVYVLWNGGDPEVAPGELLKNSAWAIVVSAGFPLVYEIGVKTALYIVETVLLFFNMDGLGSDTSSLLINTLTDILEAGDVTLLLSIFFSIMVVVLHFRMLRQGAELLIFRLGVPLATIGLVNSDGGAWPGYIQVLLKQGFSVMAQYFCIVVGVAVYCSDGGIYGYAGGIALVMTAFAAPKLLSQFVIPNGGGGGMAQKVSAVSNVIRIFTKF